jgi:Protein of unknown function (DUF1097)
MNKAFEATNLKVTLMEAFITALAATAAILIEVPIWGMFVGWIAYFTRGLDVRNALINLGCVFIGLVLGSAAALVLGSLGGPPSVAEQAAVVFGLGLVVLSLRFLPIFNNLLGFFLGLVAWFAFHQAPGVGPLMTLASAATLGSFAGAVAHRLQQHIISAAALPR